MQWIQLHPVCVSRSDQQATIVSNWIPRRLTEMSALLLAHAHSVAISDIIRVSCFLQSMSQTTHDMPDWFNRDTYFQKGTVMLFITPPIMDGSVVSSTNLDTWQSINNLCGKRMWPCSKAKWTFQLLVAQWNFILWLNWTELRVFEDVDLVSMKGSRRSCIFNSFSVMCRNKKRCV